MATDWEALGGKIGRAIAALIPNGARDRIRESYAKKYGVCRRCAAPLGGPSPEQICEPCHLDEVLKRAGGGVEPGDA